MKLEHYSNRPDLEEKGIDPKFHGTGVKGAESKRKQDPHWVDRSYHYVAGTQPEAALASRAYKYSSEVPDEKIYDYHKDPANLAAQSQDWGTFSPTLYEKRIKEAGYAGFTNPAAEGMSNVVALFHAVKPKLNKSEPQKDFQDNIVMGKLHKAKEDERAKVWGDNPNPPRMSEKRIKMMRHIRDVVQHMLGVDLEIAKGKIDEETGKLRTPVSDLPEHKKPFEIFTDKGVAEEKKRLALIAEQNKERPAIKGAKDMPREILFSLRRKRAREGVAPNRRMDPKPDWRSGKLQTQPSPDAAIHEIAHVLTSDKGLGDTQEEMDRQYGEVISKLGFLKQKATQGEIQPMAMENKLRRLMGLPANRQSQNPRPMSEHDRPVEQALDQPTPRFVRGVVQTSSGPKSVDLIRQARLLSPENAKKLDQVIRGELVYDSQKGWQPGTSINAKINQRARAISEEPDPDKYFSRKDKDTLMRSEGAQDPWFYKRHVKQGLEKAKQEEGQSPKVKRLIREERRQTAPKKPVPASQRLEKDSDYNKQIAQKIKELKAKHAEKKEPTTAEQVRAVKEKYKQSLKKFNTSAARAIGSAFGGSSIPPPPPPPPPPPASTSSGGGIGLDAGKVAAFKPFGKTDSLQKDDAPHMPETPEDKAHDVMEEGQSLQSAIHELGASDKIRAMFRHIRNSGHAEWTRSEDNRLAGKDVNGEMGKSDPEEHQPAPGNKRSAHAICNAALKKMAKACKQKMAKNKDIKTPYYLD